MHEKDMGLMLKCIRKECMDTIPPIDLNLYSCIKNCFL